MNTDTAITTLFSDVWETRGYDAQLRQALDDSLPALGACATAVYIAGRDVSHAHVQSRYSGEDSWGWFQEVFKESAKLAAEGKQVQAMRSSGEFSAVIVPLAIRAKADIATAGDKISPSHLCGILFHHLRSSSSSNMRAEARSELHARSTAPLLFEVFRQRERRFSPFAPRISERYWKDSGAGASIGSVSLLPPWEQKGQLRTATVSFDLRRSTFCMEQADEASQFGEWLDELVQILTAVCHLHAGVFDKFTGDGALVHFLKSECLAVDAHEAVQAALSCSVDMQSAIHIHLERLRQFLRIDSRLLGAGIAIDTSEAFWSLDHKDNPIVVGPGVVHACRLCDGASSGRIRMTNIVRRKLQEAIVAQLPSLDQVNLETKEINSRMETVVWECQTPTPPTGLDLGSPMGKISELCNSVYKQLGVTW